VRHWRRDYLRKTHSLERYDPPVLDLSPKERTRIHDLIDSQTAHDPVARDQNVKDALAVFLSPTSFGKKRIPAKCGMSKGLRFQIDLLVKRQSCCVVRSVPRCLPRTGLSRYRCGRQFNHSQGVARCRSPSVVVARGVFMGGIRRPRSVPSPAATDCGSTGKAATTFLSLGHVRAGVAC
jgi:hypothetical protein